MNSKRNCLCYSLSTLKGFTPGGGLDAWPIAGANSCRVVYLHSRLDRHRHQARASRSRTPSNDIDIALGIVIRGWPEWMTIDDHNTLGHIRAQILANRDRDAN